MPLVGTRVLIVDDSEDNQRIFRFFLEHAGASIEVVGDGSSAVARLLRTDLPRPNLVLMDIDMPEMDGCEATKRIRAFGIKTPIVALTGHALSGDRTRCLAAGCDDHVAKPVDRTALVRLCGRWGAGHAAASHAA
jgi:CheY-like chemotaxis protein